MEQKDQGRGMHFCSIIHYKFGPDYTDGLEYFQFEPWNKFQMVEHSVNAVIKWCL